MIEVWHNVLWSRYKGRVFSALHRIAVDSGENVRFVQMAETEGDRIALGQVDLTYHRYPYELLYRGAIDRVPRWRSMPRFFWRGLTSRSRFVVIAGYAAPQDWAQMIGLMLSRTPRGVFCDSTINESRGGRLRGAAKRFFFRRVDLIFCYGERARAMALAFGASPAALVNRCQAAALPDSYDATAVPALRALAVPAHPTFLYVGRLAPEKNLKLLLDAFAQFRRTHGDALLRLAGAGPLRDALQAQAQSLGINDAVAFLGGVDQDALAGEYLSATALVLPSLREPWGLVVNEALSYGCPVLVSDRCGCVPELVWPGKSGVSFDPDDVDALVSGMEDLASPAAPDAHACLAVIASFTPERAAQSILDGINARLS